MFFKLSVPRLILLIIVMLPGFSGCKETIPVSLVLNTREVFLHPGDTVTLEVSGFYTAGKSEKTLRLSQGVSFQSSRPDLILVDKNGIISVSREAVAGGSILSGESGEISVTFGSLKTSCLVVLRKDPARTINARGIVTNAAALDVLVNKTRFLPENYIPPRLVRVEVPTCLAMDEVNQMRLAASEALSRMFRAAKDEAGFTLTARSGYRSWNTQKYLFQSNVDTRGQEYADRYSARPGTSEHQTGLVMDITSLGMNFQLDESFGESPEGRWAAENAHRFGFIIRYQKGKEAVTGYAYEPWHLRFVGVPLAGEIYRRGLVLEEFFLLPERT